MGRPLQTALVGTLLTVLVLSAHGAPSGATPGPPVAVLVPKPLSTASKQAPAPPSRPIQVDAHVTGTLQNGDNELSRWADPITIFTALLVLVGAGQVWFLRNTDKATTKAAEAAQKSAEVAAASADAVVSQLRAYVGIKSCDLDAVGVGQGATRATVTLKNTGQTPAFNLTQWAAMGVDFFPLQNGLPQIAAGQQPGPVQPLGPGAEILVKPIFAQPLQAHHVAALNAGTMAIYVIGEVTYTDAFKKDRVLKYCLFSNSLVNIAEGHMAAYELGNDAT